MSARRVSVTLAFDASSFVASMRQMSRAMRPFKRLADTPGDRHIERIIRDCLDRRLDPTHTARRLMVASDLARLLDGRNDR